MKRLNEYYPSPMKSLRNPKGQGVVEYALILLLIAIVVVAMLKGIGVGTNEMYSTVNSAFS